MKKPSKIDHPDQVTVAAEVGEQDVRQVQLVKQSLEAALADSRESTQRLKQEIASVREEARLVTIQFQTKEDELKKLERILERAKREWEATFDSVKDMVILTDSPGKIIRCNLAACKYLHKTYSELIDSQIEQHFFGIVPVDALVFQSDIIEVQFPELYGWFEVANYTLKLRGESLGIVHVVKDITERRQAQEDLRLSQEDLRRANDELENRVRERTLELIKAIMDLRNEVEERQKIQAVQAKEKDLLSVTLLSIRDGVLSTDKDGLITLFNQAAEQITGVSQKKAIGRSINQVFKLLDDKTGQYSYDVLPLLLGARDELGAVKTHNLVSMDGRRLLVSCRGALIHNQDAELVGYVMVITDITEQKQIEAHLALSQKMESIGQLAAGIAHEINTPMQYIGDNTHFMKEAFDVIKQIFTQHQQIAQIDAVDPAKIIVQMERLAEMNKKLDLDYYMSEIPSAVEQSLDGIERVRKIVLAMKSFSHPTQKEKQMADINQAIETTVTISHSEWKYTADLEMDLDPELPAVYCMIDEINQVILNMIVNAAQAIQSAIVDDFARGKITIQTRHQNDTVSIKIQDTGGGVTAENLSRIFDPFFTTKDVGKGTGQGLSMAHNIIVNEHKGRIEVASEVGKGTTFVIILPVNNPDAEKDIEVEEK